MDLRCSKCGEPWEFDSLHDRVSELHPGAPWKVDGRYVQSEYDKYLGPVRADFQRRGCEALGERHSSGEAHPGIGAIYELLGDDLDGAAAMFEDFNL